MGDLVRFWYAALFFASAYTLKEDGHVRVDVFTLLSKDALGRYQCYRNCLFRYSIMLAYLTWSLGKVQFDQQPYDEF